MRRKTDAEARGGAAAAAVVADTAIITSSSATTDAVGSKPSIDDNVVVDDLTLDMICGRDSF